jgi:branched-chain amino acid transport system substrate-binding protein
MKKILSIKAVLGTVAMAVSLSAASADVKVGALYPFSGALALLGDESYRGFELAVEERNAAGGINGNKIQVVKADAVDANQAVGEARKLTSVDNVSVVFGSFSSSLSAAATQVTELAGVPYFELGAISDAITGRGFKYVFRSNPRSRTFADTTVEAVVNIVAPGTKTDPKALRVALVYEDGLYGASVSAAQKEKAKELGLNVVESLAYSAKAVDLSSLVLRLKGAKADVILQTSYLNDTVLFLRQLKEAGVKPKAIIGTGGGYSLQDMAATLGPENAEGLFDVDFLQYETNEAGAPGLKDFVAAYKKKYGSSPRSGHSLANYVGAKIFFDAMAKAGSLDKDKIRAAVLAYHLPAGKTANGWGAKFSEDGQNQLTSTPIMQWRGGKLLTVYPKSAAVVQPKL